MQGDDYVKASAEFILSNVSQRMAAQIREEATELGKIKKSVGEDAMGSVTNAIKELEDTGTITLREPDDDENEDEEDA